MIFDGCVKDSLPESVAGSFFGLAEFGRIRFRFGGQAEWNGDVLFLARWGWRT